MCFHIYLNRLEKPSKIKIPKKIFPWPWLLKMNRKYKNKLNMPWCTITSIYILLRFTAPQQVDCRWKSSILNKVASRPAAGVKAWMFFRWGYCLQIHGYRMFEKGANHFCLIILLLNDAALFNKVTKMFQFVGCLKINEWHYLKSWRKKN